MVSGTKPVENDSPKPGPNGVVEVDDLRYAERSGDSPRRSAVVVLLGGVDRIRSKSVSRADDARDALPVSQRDRRPTRVAAMSPGIRPPSGVERDGRTLGEPRRTGLRCQPRRRSRRGSRRERRNDRRVLRAVWRTPGSRTTGHQRPRCRKAWSQLDRVEAEGHRTILQHAFAAAPHPPSHPARAAERFSFEREPRSHHRSLRCRDHAVRRASERRELVKLRRGELDIADGSSLSADGKNSPRYAQLNSPLP